MLVEIEYLQVARKKNDKMFGLGLRVKFYPTTPLLLARAKSLVTIDLSFNIAESGPNSILQQKGSYRGKFWRLSTEKGVRATDR